MCDQWLGSVLGVTSQDIGPMNAPQAHLLDIQDEDLDGKEEFEEASERLSPTVLDGDDGTLLLCILERLLLAEPCITQRNSIFQTRRTVKQLVCEMIIDNGSYENFVSKAMV